MTLLRGQESVLGHGKSESYSCVQKSGGVSEKQMKVKEMIAIYTQMYHTCVKGKP